MISVSKTKLHIVWLKRDFRLYDHAPLNTAVKRALHHNEKLLIFGLIEPELWALPQYSDRQKKFLVDSVAEMNAQLQNDVVYLIEQEALAFFTQLLEHFDIQAVYSDRETGIKHTFDRDILMAEFFRSQDISWHEWDANGVRRGLRKRTNWIKRWSEDVLQTPLTPNIQAINAHTITLDESFPFATAHSGSEYWQRGGELRAHRVLHSFLSERIKSYARSISKPRESRKGCSRISPHLAWGNLSVRQVLHTMKEAPEVTSKRNVRAFADRLRWQAHFIQKFESEWEYEFVPINRSYTAIDALKPMDWTLFEAWKNGETGVPLVDACMRCLAQTGYLNFRMRAMVVSFYSQYLWLPWKPGADFLAGLFTDFEPGIHYTQFQMQSGYTGVNTIRIYNPIKQSQDHDPEGIFIKEWIPELANIPKEYIHEPWKIPPMERILLDLDTGSYPLAPIVPLNENRKRASDVLYAQKKTKQSKAEGQRILDLHVNPGTRRV